MSRLVLIVVGVIFVVVVLMMVVVVVVGVSSRNFCFPHQQTEALDKKIGPRCNQHSEAGMHIGS